jgi:hypothetical protein
VAAPALRPLGIGETLDVSIKIYLRNAAPLAKLVFLVVAPVTLVSVIVQASAIPTSDQYTFDPVTGELTLRGRELWTLIAGSAVSVVLVVVASVLATAACFKAVADAYLGKGVDWRGSLRYALQRFGSVLWITILAAVISILGLVLCILPGIWLWFSFAVAVPVLLTEGLKGRKALGRSRRLVQGRWWKVFAAIALGTLLTSIVSGALTGLATVFADSNPRSFSGIAVSWVGDTLASTLTTPFSAAVAIVVYFDLRVRKEAFDLQLLAEQLGVEPPEGAAAMPMAPLAEPPPGEQPPYWPPPPGWAPRSSTPPEPEEPDQRRPDDL